MPLAIVKTITLRDFRRTGQFSGEVRVIVGSRTRRGARWQRGQADCNSPELAGLDAASFADAGGSAHTSDAHAAIPETGAGPAEPKAENAKRAPKQKKPPKKHTNPADEQKAKAREEKKKEEEEKARGSTKSGGSGKGGGDDDIPSIWEERACLNGGMSLPNSFGEFVDMVNEWISLVRVAELTLRSPDDKVARGLLEKLLEAKYGKATRTDIGSFFAASDPAPRTESQTEQD